MCLAMMRPGNRVKPDATFSANVAFPLLLASVGNTRKKLTLNGNAQAAQSHNNILYDAQGEVVLPKSLRVGPAKREKRARRVGGGLVDEDKQRRLESRGR